MLNEAMLKNVQAGFLKDKKNKTRLFAADPLSLTKYS